MATDNEWIGKTLGSRYKIEKMLGKGGMSAVYKAFDPNLKRVVAVKLIHAHLSQNPEFLGRFETEAAAVAKLRHPNIVQVYDFNHDEGLFYMVLEYIEGETLYDRLHQLKDEGKHLEIKDTIRYALNVSEAVDYAHQKMMYHRDIKPANVMITPQDQAVLMDFGIAKIVGEQAHTAAGNVIGTVRYMAPEQILGQKADHRADIYSTGVMLFEMLAGRAPFEGDSAVSMMKMHLNDPVPDLQELGVQVPANLTAITIRALEKERERRYQTAGEMANALKKALIQYEHKEAELFRTVRLAQDELADLSAPTQQVLVPDQAAPLESTDPGKTRKIGDDRLLEEVQAPAAAQPAKPPSGDPLKTVAVDYEDVKEPGMGQTEQMASGAAPGSQAGVMEAQRAPIPASGAAPGKSASSGKRKLNPLLVGGLIVGAIALVAVLVFAVGMFGGKNETASQATMTNTGVALAAQATTTGVAATNSSEQAAPTQPPAPSEVPTEAPQTTEAPASTEEPAGVVNENPNSTGGTGNPAASQPGEVYFQAEFEDPAEMSLMNIFGDDNTGEAFTADIADGQLQLTVAKEQAALYAEYNLLLENPDVRIETQASKVAGPNSNEIGVICRSSEQGFYFLAYTSAGKWVIYRYQAGTGDNGWNTLASGTSNAILMTNASNQIAGSCAGNQLILEVNGAQIGSATDDVLTTGGYAGAAIWGEFPGLGVNFDYLYANVP
ncbi:MAG: hypothetical protein A2Z16_06635 [Chloroflexi bacterium RBG_16_54_18]|nr:MAG: hypothetical protein A2Z16_06635 [Chloroflexi bacterium RBG_16_54_18]